MILRPRGHGKQLEQVILCGDQKMHLIAKMFLERLAAVSKARAKFSYLTLAYCGGVTSPEMVPGT